MSKNQQGKSILSNPGLRHSGAGQNPVDKPSPGSTTYPGQALDTSLIQGQAYYYKESFFDWILAFARMTGGGFRLDSCPLAAECKSMRLP